MNADYALMVKVNGRLDMTASTELDAALAEIMSPGKISEIQFDFSDLEYIADPELSVLLSALKKVSPFGGTVHIQSANDSVRNVLSMAGLDTMFVIE